MVAFRREKFEPLGGPAGGDGGAGGNIIVEVDEGLNTLIDFRYNRHFKAKRGEDGMSKSKHGRNADPLIIQVPPGTTIYDDDNGELLGDLTNHKQQLVIAKGGRGGRGNNRFATPRNPAPNISENGEPGEEKNIRFELKLLADVGLIGFPNVGKSTLLATVSAAKPKIADYHFTTLAPNLGVVKTDDHRSFVMADLPGLIEGAHEGIGLGHQFLRHIDRTRLLVHVIDMSAMEGRDPYEDYLKINEELVKYDEQLANKPQIIVANKMDMPEAEELLHAFQDKIGEDKDIITISALTKSGLKQLLYNITDMLEEVEVTSPTIEDTQESKVIYRHEKNKQPFEITRDPDGAFVLYGEEIERLFKMTDFTQYESTQRFSRQLRTMGVDDALRKRGAKDGDTVRLLDFEFEFIE